MSMYGVVLEKLRGDGVGQTTVALAATLNVPTTAVQDAVDMLVRDGRVSDVGGGVYKETAGREDV